MSGPIVLALRLLVVVALYGFLSFTLITLWLDLQRETRELAGRSPPRIILTVQTDSSTTRLQQFNQSEITLGRSPSCDIPLPDETVSARHAQLTFHHGQWWVEDQGSMNGTRLNDTLIFMPTVLTAGDEIECGKTRLTINLPLDASVSPTQRLEKTG
jgi:pSer/pThr/pTyr-binding forkhead associated (FHA) protein